MKQKTGRVAVEGRKIVKDFQNGGTDTRVLKGVSLKIDQGEFVSIMGPSGSGKSTLLYILGGLDVPTGGQVLHNGVDISRLRDEQMSRMRRQKIGFVFQFYNLIPNLDLEENVLLPLLLDGQKAGNCRQRLDRILEIVGLSHRRRHKPRELSGGQQQRVGIARAFVAKPKVIFADEPTGNLDSTTSRQVLYSMLEMAKSYGITFVMVTHEKELAYCGDRIVTIKDGRVLDNVLLGEDEKAENRRRLFGDVTSGDIAEPETTVAEGKKPAARQAKAVAAAVAEKVNQESM